MDEERIGKLMKNLRITREEAIQVLQTDKEIDRGAKLIELPEELQAGAKKAKRAERKKDVPVHREKKAKPEKVEICEAMQEGLKGLGIEGFDIANPEREFAFTWNGVKYKVVLSLPRK